MGSKALAKDLLQLFKTSLYADAEIHCQGDIWKVHKTILAARSPFFAAAFSTAWKEGETNQVHLEEMNKDVLPILLTCIYGGDLPEYKESFHGADPLICLERYANLWKEADFLQMPELGNSISERLAAKMAEAFRSLCTYIEITRPPRLSRSKSWLDADNNLDLFLQDLDKALRVIYSIPLPAARKPQLLFTTCVLSMRTRMPQEQLRTLRADLPDFGDDTASALVNLHFGYGQLGVIRGTDYLADEIRVADQTFVAVTSCSKCSTLLERGRGFDAPSRTFCPYFFGNKTWCEICAPKGMEESFHDFLHLLQELEKQGKAE